MLVNSETLKYSLSLLIFFYSPIYGDSFKYNSYNNHGVIGLINMPSARFLNESSHGITIYKGTPDQKITLSSSPYNWLEASFFYTNINNKAYCTATYDPVCSQDYKDKGFNFKIRLKEEGILPAIAIGINDIAGTGLYSSEYIVGSYGLQNLDFHFGLGWGSLNGSQDAFKNPLGYIYDGFKNRPEIVVGVNTDNRGGQFQPSTYFSGEQVSPFYGITYVVNQNLILKIEKDTTLIPGQVGYERPESEFSFGFDYRINDNFSLGFAQERNNYSSFRFVYKYNPLKSLKKYQYKKAENPKSGSNYTKLIRNLENNGIGVNKIIESQKSIGLELTQFSHPNLDIIEEIIRSASIDAGINKEIKKDIKIANLKALSEYDIEFEKNSKLIYQRETTNSFNNNTKVVFRPFLASREEFFKGALLIENNSEYVINDNFFFSSNLKYSIANNFDDLTIPPAETYPAQVRSDVKDYLRNFDKGILIGRAQFDYHISPKKNNHLMFTAGILEEMFSGYGMEYLYFEQSKNYALGFELFNVSKRDHRMRFGTLDYKNTTSAINFYYRNYSFIPFDSKISFGEYLAGDTGFTFELSRSYINGVEFGIFATFTDVSFAEFGEGSFDKGIFFNIPIYGNLINYSWKPLTKDPGSKLIRKHTLHDLLIKFRPYNP